MMRFLELFAVIFVVTLYYKLPPTQKFQKADDADDSTSMMKHSAEENPLWT